MTMPYGSPLHADHEAWPTRTIVPRAHVTAEPTLAAALARCGGTGGQGSFASDEALGAVAAFALRASANGQPPAQIATVVRRSLAAAAPAAMTVVAFENVARALVRHALHTLLTD
jgi:hypothetical protein